MISRRRLITTLPLVAAGSALLAPARGRAQRPRRPTRVGYLSGSGPDDPSLATVRSGLARLGWVEGNDFVLVPRFAGFDYARFPALVDELVREGIDVLVAIGPAATVVPITQHVVPVVFGVSNDPVLFGLVSSLARPGGNATGVTQLMYELAGKRLDILRQLAPGTRRAAVLYSPPLHAGDAQERTVIEQSAGQLGIETIFHVVRDRAEVLAAFSSAATSKCDSVLCFHGPVTFANRAVIAERATALRLASAFSRREFCEAGGLVSYGPNIEETYGRLAYFVQRISNGARAGELPVERPTAIETVINRKTVNALGLAPPTAVLMAADEVIE